MNTLNHKSLNSKPIGFFDSGVGGLSVYASFKKILPNEDTLYYGDLANLPYGNKTQVELIGFAKNILSFFEDKGVKAVVIACNTSSAQAYEYIKDDYDFKIYPIIQSCAKVIALSGYKRIGVFATEATVKSKVYTRELQKYNKYVEVSEIPCPSWVSFVENNKYTEIDAIKDVKAKLDEMLQFLPDKIILGCTHYPYLLSLLKEFAPKELFIDPAEIFVDYIKSDLSKNNLLSYSGGKESFYVSANPEKFKDHAKIFYNVKNMPELV